LGRICCQEQAKATLRNTSRNRGAGNACGTTGNIRSGIEKRDHPIHFLELKP
jgi:hypothetical protein